MSEAGESSRAFLFDGEPERLDRFIAGRMAPLSRTYLQRMIKEGRVRVDGATAPARRLLVPGEKIEVSLPPFSSLPAAAAQTVPVLYEDRRLIVVDKPAGLVVAPAGPHREDTLVQRLWPKLAAGWGGALQERGARGPARPGVVHRLDKGTSGVMVIAKTPEDARALSRQFAERSVEKIYWALARGAPLQETGRVKSAVGRARRGPPRMSTSAPGRPSETVFRVLRRFPAADASLLEVRPLTGRTHQIRVQLAALGHPLLGDALYGGPAGERPLLHALSLTITHPATGERRRWTAPPPADFIEALRAMGWNPPRKKWQDNPAP